MQSEELTTITTKMQLQSIWEGKSRYERCKSNIIIPSQLELRNKCDDSHDGTRERWRTKPSRFPTLCAAALFFLFLFFFYYGGGDSSSRREVKGKGDLQMPVNHPWGYIALANHLVLFPLHW